MNLDFNVMQNPIAFFSNEFYPALLNLDLTAIALLGIGLIVLFVLIILVVKLFAWVLSLAKRFILFLIIALSLTAFLLRFSDDLLAQPPNYLLIGVGVVGVVIAFIALIISVLSIRREWKGAKGLREKEIKKEIEKVVQREIEKGVEKSAKIAANPSIAPTQLQQPRMFTTQALTTANLLQSFHDRSILAVLSYIVVAEFGVFSSITISAPTEMVGIGLFVSFMVAAFVFIKTSYRNYSIGVRHLIVGAIFGILLSILLGHIWVGTPLEMLLSLQYFTTNSLVAFIAGLAVSLFMGSKG